MKLSIYLLVCLIISSLTACGFQLRGSYNIPSTIKNLELKLDTNSALYFPLRDSLQQAGIQLDASDYTLEILEDSLNKQTTITPALPRFFHFHPPRTAPFPARRRR